MEFKVNKIILLPLFLFGCATTQEPPKDPCADRPVYKEYSIEVPKRPVLGTNSDITNHGDLSRSVQKDFSSIAEYAEKLENIVKSIANKKLYENSK